MDVEGVQRGGGVSGVVEGIRRRSEAILRPATYTAMVAFTNNDEAARTGLPVFPPRRSRARLVGSG